MTEHPFHHLHIGHDEIAGNDGRGRVVFLPGSDHRAKRFAERFHDLRVFPSPRQLNVYVGTVHCSNGLVFDAAAVPTGMGCPSVNIVATELVGLGARRLLRVGSAGSLQPKVMKAGSLVIATSAVRDEGTSDAFAPRDIPATAHLDWVMALRESSERLGFTQRTWAGMIHTKDTFYGREIPSGPRQENNEAYMRMLRQLGVLATEMELAHLFILAASLGPDTSSLAGASPSSSVVKAGGLLAIIGDDEPFAPRDVALRTEEDAVSVAILAAGSLLATEGGPAVQPGGPEP